MYGNDKHQIQVVILREEQKSRNEGFDFMYDDLYCSIVFCKYLKCSVCLKYIFLSHYISL